LAWAITSGVSVLGKTAGGAVAVHKKYCQDIIESLESKDSQPLPSGLVFEDLKSRKEK